MPYGDLAGDVNEWSDKDINDAKNAGIFFTPYTAIRDYGTNKGYAVDWDANTGNVKINNNPYTPQQLTDAGFKNYNGRWMGSDKNINKFFGGIKTNINDTTSNTNNNYTYTPLGQTSNYNYNYAPGSAQGPATYEQAYTPNGTGTVSIVPAEFNNDSSWYLSSWSSLDDKWTSQPTLTIAGKQYKFNTPTEYINELKNIKSRGATGDIDNLLSQFETANKYWLPAQEKKAKQKTNENNIQTVNNANNNQQLTLRDTLSQLGIDLKWDNATGNVTIGNKVYTPQQLQQAGLANVDGRWTGTGQQIASLFGANIPLRDVLTQAGYKVDFRNGLLYVNDLPIGDSNKLLNINGRLYGNENDFNSIVKIAGQTTGAVDNQQGNSVLNKYKDGSFDVQNDPLYKSLLDELKASRESLANFKGNQEVVTNLIESIRDFKSGYEEQLKGIISQLSQPFNYDPNTDTALKDAIKYADRTMMEEMNARGVLSSTMTADNAVRIRSELLPKYQNLALERYNSNISRLIQVGNFIEGLDNKAFDRYSSYAKLTIENLEKIDERTTKSYEKVITNIKDVIKEYEDAKKNQYERDKDLYSNALDKLDKIGYVDNEISSLTGLPVGTPSQKAREALEKRIDTYNLEQFKSDLNIKEAKEKSKLAIDEINAQSEIKNKEYQRKQEAANIINSLGDMQAKEIRGYLNQKDKDGVSNLAKISEYADIAEIVKFITEKEKQEENTRQKNIDNDLAERRFQESEARADAREARSTARSNESSQKLKESPHFNNIYSKVGSIINSYENDKDKKGNLKKYGKYTKMEWARRPGSFEYNQITETVLNSLKNGLISRDEAELIFNTYNIPY